MSVCPRLARAVARSRLSTSHPCRPLAATALINPVSSTPYRTLHSSPNRTSKPTNPDPRENPAHDLAPNADVNVGQKRLADFDLKGKVFVVTGAAQGLGKGVHIIVTSPNRLLLTISGLSLAEGLVEAGGKGEPSLHEYLNEHRSHIVSSMTY
jgi:hypothetical protein